jgi:hypothetical protein
MLPFVDKRASEILEIHSIINENGMVLDDRQRRIQHQAMGMGFFCRRDPEAGHVHKGFFEASDSLEFRTGSTGQEHVGGLLRARLAATISSAFDQCLGYMIRSQCQTHSCP